MNGRNIGIVGGGPAGLMAAEHLARAGARVDLFDAMPSVGRKFLLAGKGGLNLTHSEPLPSFVHRYGRGSDHFKPLLEHFGPEQLRAWAAGLGVETFVGTSGRVFPQDFKAAPLMRAWVRRLRQLEVRFHAHCRWTGFDGGGGLAFRDPERSFARSFDAVLLALGGASWSRLGSDGSWAGLLAGLGCRIAPFRPANCGFLASWSEHMAAHFGSPLKNVTLAFSGRSVKGEALIADYGIEGSAVYALSAALRDAIEADGQAWLSIDLKPDLSVEAVSEKLARPRGRLSQSNWLRKCLNLPPAAIALLWECGGKKVITAGTVKSLPLRLVGTRPLDEAISTAGGLCLEELDGNFMVRRRPGLFAAGEMLDWEAPTGGYLLTGCMSQGAAAARGIRSWLGF
ncbi:MAG TPA: TIGR03862 family flavoprotein [Candidatus Sulfotelmatobacter sp.]|jgi:uncharacterized flavoprotein (TIGR03862 family)|nr:TIGR03862 family flavoprotein [Candidatus Sulfotelmatobacter sp.]